MEKAIVKEETAVKKIRKLNPKQKMFCQLYSSDKEFFGNGVESYMKAYGLSKNRYNTAKANASKLLTKPNILLYINSLLELRGLNDAFVDKQLELLVTQNANLKVKLGGIKEYNVLKKRTDGKVEKHLHLHKHEEIGSERRKLIDEYEAKLKKLKTK